MVRHEGVALVIYSLVMFPGVILHEGSHWLMAKVLRVPTRGLSLLPGRTRDGRIRFGYVETGQADPIRASLIGLAPLVVGALSLELLALEHLGLRELGGQLAAGQWAAIAGQMLAIASTPDLFLWLYLVLSISNTMLPSKADRAAWLPAILFVIAVGVLMAALGALESAFHWLQPMASAGATGLTGVLLVAAGVDLILIGPLILLEAFLTRLLGWEVIP